VIVTGVDEVGRGSLVGPLYAVAACFTGDEHSHCPIPGVRDSKEFRDKVEMQRVYRAILKSPALLALGWGIASVEEINTHGIDVANLLAFKQAVLQVAQEMPPGLIIIDGLRPIPGLPAGAQKILPKADKLYWQVSAASILAKVLRDEHLRDLDKLCPGYGWSENSGYGTQSHRQAILDRGPTPYHRRQFIQKIIGGREKQWT